MDIDKSFNLNAETDNALEKIKATFNHIPNQEVWNQRAKPLFSKLICNAIENLKTSIYDPNFPDINENSPFIETSYPTQTNYTEIKMATKEAEKQQKAQTTLPLKTMEEQCLNIANRNRLMEIICDAEFEIPQELLITKDFFNGETPIVFKNIDAPTAIIPFKGEFSQKGKVYQFNGAVAVTFFRLCIVKSTNEARFPVLVALATQEDTHKSFNKETSLKFWDALISKIKAGLIIEQTLTTNDKHLTKVLSTPRPPILKSPIHFERSKFGSSSKEYQLELFKPLIDDYNKGRSKGTLIELVGLDLSPSHHDAIIAIQKLLANTNYKGNVDGTSLTKEENEFRFEGSLPRLKFTKSEYLEAYGVKKYQTARGKWEYSGAESKISLEALRFLGEKPHLIVQKKTKWKDGKPSIDRIQTISPIVRVYEGWKELTEKEDASLDVGNEDETMSQKHKGFVVELCPLLVEDIDTYFVLKPANIYQEIRLSFPNPGKFAYLFIDWLLHEATQKRRTTKSKTWPTTVKIGKEALANVLRMESYIKTRNWKRIDSSLNKCFEIAKTLGWIIDFEAAEGKSVDILFTFRINSIRFNQINEPKELTVQTPEAQK